MMPRFLHPETIEGLDDGIKYIVEILNLYGIETYESCDGSDGHSYVEPSVRFHGNISEGYRAASVAISNGFPLKQLNRVWVCHDMELEGPEWEMRFWKGVPYDVDAVSAIKFSIVNSITNVHDSLSNSE